MPGYCRNILSIVWDPLLSSLALPSPAISAFCGHCLLSLTSLPGLQHWACCRNCSRSVMELEIFATCLPGLRQIWGLSFRGIKDCNPDKLSLENRGDSMDNQTEKHQELVKSWECDDSFLLFSFTIFHVSRHTSYKSNDFREILKPQSRWIFF